MNEHVLTTMDGINVDDALLRMLDRGIDDVKAGRVLPHEEAMQEVRRIREERRREREADRAAVNK